eukprot:GHVS01013161.1.p1 GENE.GHVS01013161.1~~GHVS01013161.1.p1  ORF type:complete len:241 (-),score=37.39 GHVS01013161.1:231-953(-)
MLKLASSSSRLLFGHHRPRHHQAMMMSSCCCGLRSLPLPSCLSSSPFLSRGLGAVRGAVIPPHISMPAPPPREFNVDGTPKRYRLNQKIYEHNYTFERWWVHQVGVFHTVYHVDFAQAVPPFRAWLRSFNLTTMVIIKLSYCALIAVAYLFLPLIGIKPKYFTPEWQEAMKERDRAENSNAIQCYLDRRRKERGPHWLGREHWYGSVLEYNTRNSHDFEAQQTRAAKLNGKVEEAGESDD